MEQILIRPQSFVRRLFQCNMVRYMFSINYDGRFQTLYIIGEVSPVKLASKWCMPTINIGTVRAGGILEGREKTRSRLGN